MSQAASKRIMERVVAGICLAFAFLVMASIFSPDSTKADDHGHHDGHHDHLHSTDPHAGLTALGSLQDDRYIVRISGRTRETQSPASACMTPPTGPSWASSCPRRRLFSASRTFSSPTMNIDDVNLPNGPLMMIEPSHAWGH